MSYKPQQELFEEYQQSVKLLSTITDFFEYEKKFVSLHNEFGKQMLELSISQTKPSERKKIYNKIWRNKYCLQSSVQPKFKWLQNKSLFTKFSISHKC